MDLIKYFLNKITTNQLKFYLILSILFLFIILNLFQETVLEKNTFFYFILAILAIFILSGYSQKNNAAHIIISLFILHIVLIFNFYDINTILAHPIIYLIILIILYTLSKIFNKIKIYLEKLSAKKHQQMLISGIIFLTIFQIFILIFGLISKIKTILAI